MHVCLGSRGTRASREDARFARPLKSYRHDSRMALRLFAVYECFHRSAFDVSRGGHSDVTSFTGTRLSHNTDPLFPFFSSFFFFSLIDANLFRNDRTMQLASRDDGYAITKIEVSGCKLFCNTYSGGFGGFFFLISWPTLLSAYGAFIAMRLCHRCGLILRRQSLRMADLREKYKKGTFYQLQ